MLVAALSIICRKGSGSQTEQKGKVPFGRPLRIDRRMQIHLINLGCARNQVDSEIMTGRLEKAGHDFTEDPAQAEAAGISVVYQELSLVPDLDVAENIYLHREPRRAGIFLAARGD